MKNLYPTLTVIAGLALSTQTAAESQLSRNEVEYRGDYLARQVCRAIVLDDPRQLHRVLRLYRHGLPWGYKMDLTGDAVAGRFSCNGRPLLTFSEEIEAARSSYFLTTGQLTDKPPVLVSHN